MYGVIRKSCQLEKKENPGCNIVVVYDNEVEKRRQSRIPTNTKVNTSWAVRCWEEWAVERNVSKDFAKMTTTRL